MIVPNERRQFRILVRNFLFRIIDLELISARGEMQTLLIQFAALLAGFNFVVSVVVMPRYARFTHEQLMTAVWGDEEFLIATTMAVAGLFAVPGWNATLPDGRDNRVLGMLPVSQRVTLLAKITAA